MAKRTNTVRPHSAPGLYFKETVQTYANKSIGITTLGVSGETLRGPAFQPISISNWREFQTYFGGTSTAKFKGSQYPKYELPYIAKSYLEQSNQLEVVRVLGLSGVNAGPAWLITATKHRTYNGYNYSLLNSDPYKDEPERWNKSNTFSKDTMPTVPDINEESPEYIRVINGYRWHTLCEHCDDSRIIDEPAQTFVHIDRLCGTLIYVQDSPLTIEVGHYVLLNDEYVEITEENINKQDIQNATETYQLVSDTDYCQTIPDPAEFQYDYMKVIVDKEYNFIKYEDIENYPSVYESFDVIINVSLYDDTNHLPSCTVNECSLNIAYPNISTRDKIRFPLTLEVDQETGNVITDPEWYKTNLQPDVFAYFKLVETDNCFEKEPIYSYYSKIWQNGIQLAEEDDCEGNRNNMVVAVIRSRGQHKKAAFVRTPTEDDIANGICDDIYSYDGIEYFAKEMRLEPSKTLTLGSSCNPGFSSVTGDFTVDSYNYGTFTIVVDTFYGETKYYSVSLNPGEKNYIYNVIGGTPDEGDAEIYVEELYDVALRQLIDEGVFNAINSEVIKYPAVKILPKYADVNDIMTESVLSKKHLGKRYLYSEELSNGIKVRYSEDGGLTWVEENGINGVIYTVFERTNTTTGKKEYFYGAYTDRIVFEYEEYQGDTSEVKWIECTQSITDEQQNVFSETPSFFNNPDFSNPEYIKIIDGTETVYIKKVVDIENSTRAKKPTERLTQYNYRNDVVDGRFTNCVKVIADDMVYVNTVDSVTGLEDVFPITLDFNNYREQYRYASTPWIVSEIKGSAEQVQLAKLFRFHTISDGNSSSLEIKISIENIDPSTGKFDVVVRNFNDTDLNVNAIERFVGCTLVPGDPDYIALKIGSFDESYNAVSSYITVEVIESDITKNSIPAGFLGYPMRNYNGFAIKGNTYKYIKMDPQPSDRPTGTVDKTEVPYYVYDNDPEYIYVNNVYYVKEQSLTSEPKQPYFKFNTDVDDDIKIKKQYFGVSDLVGIDTDSLTYKGVEAYNGVPSGLTPCFHLDARILNGTPNDNGEIEDGDLIQVVSVDGVTGYSWVTVNKNLTTNEGIEPRIGSDNVMYGTIYEDKKYRKFTVAFYGGWDGWDYYRTYRSNTNEFRSKEYKGYVNSVSGYGDMFNMIKNPEVFDFGSNEKAITSDYYAYLAGVRQFNNPKAIAINVLATPGIDYVNNGQLVNEVIDMVEEERQDCVYIVTTPDKPFGASDSKYDMYDADEVVANLEDSDIDSNHTTTYYPWVKYFDVDSSDYIYLPITRDVVKSIALTDNQAFSWYASAGWTRGPISGDAPKRRLKQGEQDTLYDGRINFVASFAGEDFGDEKVTDRIWGDKNLQIADNQLNRLSARRLLLRIKRMLQTSCIGLIFDPNDNNQTKAIRSSVSTVLDYVKENRGITDYRIEIDDSPSTTDQLGRGVTYYIKRSPMLEWITFNSVLTPQGMEWN